MECCVEPVSTLILLHNGNLPGVEHLAGPTLRLLGHHWQSGGTDKSAPPYHTTHVEIIGVSLSSLLPGLLFDGLDASKCTSRKIMRLLCTYQVVDEIMTFFKRQ